MRFLFILYDRLRSLILRGRRESDLREELQLHIEREAERLQANGMSAEAAGREALRLFGGVEQIKEACRDARGTGSVDALGRDVRYGVRRLARDWPFTSAAVLILGLGIGANTAIFSVVNAALFRQQGLANPERLVEVYQNVPGGGGVGLSSYPAYLDMAEHTDVFSSTTAALIPSGAAYSDGGGVRPAVVEYTTATYLTVLGLRPSLGRWFEPAEDALGAALVAVVGHEAWTRKFGADPSILGRAIRIQGVPVTIIGVGPVGHNSTVNLGVVTDFWLPMSAIPPLGGPPRALARRPEEAALFVKARLRDGVTVAQAQAAMSNLGTRLAAEYPNEDPGAGISVYAAGDVRVHPQMDTLIMALASILLVVVGLVLTIACSNLATLLLVRGAARAKEVSIRLAMGATRAQLVRHLLAESLLLSAAGGAAGCVLAWWGIGALRAADLPIALDFGVDYRVLAFTVALSLVAGVAFGLAPALKATKIDLVPTLRDDGMASSRGRAMRLKHALVVLQVAVSVLLLGVTGIFVQMLTASRTQRIGYAVDGVAMIETDARYAGYSASDARRVYEDLARRIAATPGVEAVAMTRGLPQSTVGMPLVIDGAGSGADAVVGAASIWAAPGYFDTLRIPLLFGRVFDERDRTDTPRVAVISETMARQYFGAVDAVGRRFRTEQDANGWYEVVGVVRDTGTGDLNDDLVDPTPHLFYRSVTQLPVQTNTVIARTSLDAAGLLGAMQRELRAVDPTLPIMTAKTMAQYLEDSLTDTKLLVAFLGALGALGLSLAGVGLYAVVAFAVSRQSREIGIRMALGARSQQVVWSVARQVTWLVGIGTVVGLALSLLVILALRAAVSPMPGISLYRPTPDPVALLSIVAFMAVVGMAAASLPARRAARMDPLTALRHD